MIMVKPKGDKGAKDSPPISKTLKKGTRFIGRIKKPRILLINSEIGSNV